MCLKRMAGTAGDMVYTTVLLLTALLFTTLAPVMMRYTQDELGGYSYNRSSVFFFSELLKLVLAWVWTLKLRQTDPAAGRQMVLVQSELVRYVGPAFFFFAQNNLQFIALMYMSSSAFQLLVNCRIILVAVASAVVLKQYLNPIKWLAILLLTTGSVQYQVSGCADEPMRVEPVGLLVVFLVACSAAGGNVVSELVMKDKMDQPLMFRTPPYYLCPHCHGTD